MGCTSPEDFVVSMDRFIDPPSYHRALDLQRIYESMRPIAREYIDDDVLRTLVAMQEVFSLFIHLTFCHFYCNFNLFNLFIGLSVYYKCYA